MTGLTLSRPGLADVFVMPGGHHMHGMPQGIDTSGYGTEQRPSLPGSALLAML
jgi:hypothetical protein